MATTTINLAGTSVNPDTASIASKRPIDISVNISDISSSNYTGTVQLNNLQTEIQVYVSSSSSTGSMYYAPVYAEKINYETWKRSINKSFQELGNV